MSASQLVGIVLEVLVAGIAGILLDRLLGTVALAVWLVVCLFGLGWLHWEQIGPVVGKKHQPQPPMVQVQKKPDELPPPKPEEQEQLSAKQKSEPPAKAKPTEPIPVAPPQSYNSPDPYVGQSDGTIASWLEQEANSLEDIGTKCAHDEVTALQNKSKGITPAQSSQAGGLPFGPEGVQVQFWNEFSSRHLDAIKSLYATVTYRLGPIATAQFSQEYKSLMQYVSIVEQRGPQQNAWPMCMSLEVVGSPVRLPLEYGHGFTGQIRQMAVLLRSGQQAPVVGR